MDISQLQAAVRDFAERRDWGQFHTPKNLIMALTGEVGELTELFQWLTPEESANVRDNQKLQGRVEEEIADVFIYLLRLADVLDIDLAEGVRNKIVVNDRKYPEDLTRGRAVKYSDLGDA